MRGSAADFDIGAVRFENPRHRVLAAPVVVIVVVPIAHPLVVVLTVSHVSPSVLSLGFSLDISALDVAMPLVVRSRMRCAQQPVRLQIGVVDHGVQQGRVPKSPAGASAPHGQIIQPARPKSGLIAWVFKRNIRLSFTSRSQAAQLSAIALDITCLFRNRSLGQVLD
jgi:hypothetical protein